MAYTLPPLPYAYNALEPHIDARTMEIHHTKHHQAYINNVNTAIAVQHFQRLGGTGSGRDRITQLLQHAGRQRGHFGVIFNQQDIQRRGAFPNRTHIGRAAARGGLFCRPGQTHRDGGSHVRLCGKLDGAA